AGRGALTDEHRRRPRRKSSHESLFHRPARKQIDDKVSQKHRKKTEAWKRDESFYADVAAHLRAVKAAWRNPTIHVRRDYTPEQAEEVYLHVGIFMRHLAERLQEPERPIGASSGDVEAET